MLDLAPVRERCQWIICSTSSSDGWSIIADPRPICIINVFFAAIGNTRTPNVSVCVWVGGWTDGWVSLHIQRRYMSCRRSLRNLAQNKRKQTSGYRLCSACVLLRRQRILYYFDALFLSTLRFFCLFNRRRLPLAKRRVKSGFFLLFEKPLKEKINTNWRVGNITVRWCFNM